MIILDGSVTAGSDWRNETAFATGAIQALGVGPANIGSPPEVSLGFVTNTANTQRIDMCATSDTGVLKFQLARMSQTVPSSTSKLEDAIQLAQNELTARPSAYSVILLIAKPSAYSTAATAAASAAKAASIEIVVVSISTNTGDVTLQPLASDSARWATLQQVTKTNLTAFNPLEDYNQLQELQIPLWTLPCRQATSRGYSINVLRNCTATVSHLTRLTTCECGCADQSWVLLFYIFIDLLISTLRAFWTSFQAIKSELAGQKTYLGFKGFREHACSILMIFLLALGVAFFRSPCPDNWAELPMMCVAILIFFLMWLPAFARICTAENKFGQATGELTKDFRILCAYCCGSPEPDLHSGTLKGHRATIVLGVPTAVAGDIPHNTPLPTPRVGGEEEEAGPSIVQANLQVKLETLETQDAEADYMEGVNPTVSVAANPIAEEPIEASV